MEKKKRGRPKKKLQTELSDDLTKEDGGKDKGVEGWETPKSMYQVKNEITEDTSDYLSELNSSIQSTNVDNGYHKESEDDEETNSRTDTSAIEQIAVIAFKGSRKQRKSRKRHSKSSVDMRTVLPKRKDIANKLIKRAMREARKEAKVERRKRTAVFMCNFCLNKFSLNGLKEHLKEHCSISGEELKCNLCDKILMCGNRILNFNSHLRYVLDHVFY